MGRCLSTSLIWRDRFNQSELGKSCYNASYTFRRGESCNRLDVFPQISCFYNPSRSFPGWACPHLASCPFLAFLDLFQRNGWVRVLNSFSEAKSGQSSCGRFQAFMIDNIGFRQMPDSALKKHVINDSVCFLEEPDTWCAIGLDLILDQSKLYGICMYAYKVFKYCLIFRFHLC